MSSREELPRRSLQFLGDLDIRLSELEDTAAIMEVATLSLGDHLGLSRCALLEDDPEAGVQVRCDWSRDHGQLAVDLCFGSIALECRRALHAGEPVVVDNVERDPRTTLTATRYGELGIASFAAVPYVRGGKVRTSLVVGSSTARAWSADDLWLVRQVLVRVWPLVAHIRTADALRRSCDFLRKVIDATPSMVFVKDWEGRFILTNEALERCYGTTSDEVLGKTDADFNDNEVEVAHFRHDDREVMTTRRDKLIPEEEVTHADGSVRWFSTVKVPLVNDDGSCDKILGVATDITDRKHSEHERSRLVEALEQEIHVRDDFVSVAGHELKTPLSALQLNVGLLEKVQQSPAHRAATLEALGRLTRNLSGMINGLLDVTRIRAGRLAIELEDVDLSTIAREVAARFEVEATRAGNRLELCAPAPVVGRWDRVRLDQIVTNLLSNAIKYGERRPVHVEVERRGSMARLRVTDQGIGIDPAMQDHIFDRFGRAVSGEHYRGLGLGLWIVHQIVDVLGGDIRVRSQLGKGSTFTVELPLHPIERARS